MKKLICNFLLAGTMMFGVMPFSAHAQAETVLDAGLPELAKVESNNNIHKEYLNFTGKYLMSPSQLQYAGLITIDVSKDGEMPSGEWSKNITVIPNEFGIKTRKDFENNEKAQDYYAHVFLNNATKGFPAEIINSDYFPKREIPMTPGRLDMCIWELGAIGCESFYKTGTTGLDTVDNNIISNLLKINPEKNL